MAEAPQNFSHHTRWDPVFHFFILPVFAITLIMTVVHLVRRPGLHSAWLIVVVVAAILAIFKIRMYALKVQDRVIRLEERLRLAALIDPALRSQIVVLTESQLVALRFASDAELPDLAHRALTKNMDPKAIKQAIVNWRPDNQRI